jgi:CheY-like chemotaxis protein/HPt (histidine-containing phosphotransfer) domain-containing protein
MATGRILIAEDNISNQQVALAIVKKLGYRADVVANGKEALATLRSIPYDLVLMDCQMPEMDGYEAAAGIRDPQSGVRNFRIPIVAMTAHAMKGDKEKCLAAGMNDYITKPVEPTILKATLKKWLPRNCEILSSGTTLDVTGMTENEPSCTAVFDEAALVGRLMGDREVAGMIIRGFLDDFPKELALMEAHVSARNITGAERQAHRIKGAAASVSALGLQRIAFEMEKAGKVGDWEGLAARFPELRKHFQATEEAMQDISKCAQAQEGRTCP